MPLGIDATIRYATNNWQRPIRAVRARQARAVQHAAQPRAAADADRQPRPRVAEGRRQAREQELPVLRPQGQRQVRRARVLLHRRAVRARTSRATTPPAKASDPPRGVRVAGRPLALAADAQRGARASSACDDWRYQHLPLPPHLFEETVRALPALGFRGVNVTIPHKEAALALADDATETARAIGAANTLTFEPTAGSTPTTPTRRGFLSALNTSAYDQHRARARRGRLGPRDPLRAPAGGRPRDARLEPHAGARARRSPAEFGAVVSAEPADIVVNCTSIGLHEPRRDVQGAAPPGR